MDLSQYKELHCFQGHRGGVLGIAFSPDGKTLVSGGLDTTALIWDLDAVKPRRKEPLSQKILKNSWSQLSENARQAWKAIGRLAADPDRTVPFLARHVQPASAISMRELTPWIRDLDSGKFAIREKAYQELVKLGPSIEPALQKF